MKRLHWSTWVGAAVAGLPVFAVLGLIAFVTLALRSPGSDSGAEPAAWVIGFAVVTLVSLAAAVVGGLVGAGVRWLLRKGRQPQKL